MSNKTRFYVWSNKNMPQLDNSWGCLIDLLDACLVSGVAAQAVDTLTISNGVAEAHFNSAHQYMAGQVIEISGNVTYNGTYRITEIINSNTLRFASSAAEATGVTGLTCRLPPLGYEKAFTGAQKAAYRSLNPASSKPFLRVDNAPDPAYTSTWAKFAKVGVLESMSGIDDFSGEQAPYDPSAPDKNWVGSGSGTSAVIGWARWYYARDQGMSNSDADTPETGSRHFVLVGDDRTFFLCTPFTASGSYTQRAIYGFGDLATIHPAAGSNGFVMSTLAAATVDSGPGWGGLSNTLAGNMLQTAILHGTDTAATLTAPYLLTPNPVANMSQNDGVAPALPVGIYEKGRTPAFFHGFYRGLLTTPCAYSGSGLFTEFVGDQRTLFVGVSASESSTDEMHAIFDLGDWP